ncbi:MAG: L-serine ammonia-lyase, iron-sulfur-dependent, subunit alpha [Spirochaetales bacterium]|nr:L-serine ammonia-lyase, iron-sulfur-dependent, subunit alpha [Spirochaetales bacterium]
MFSIKNLFRHGPGPSSLYSIHPFRIAKEFKDECHDATTIIVTLYGQLKDNSQENFTVQALKNAISPFVTRIVLNEEEEEDPEISLAKFQAFGKKKSLIKEATYHFTKLGELSEIEDINLESVTIKDLLDWTYENGRSIWEFAVKTDSSNLEEYMSYKWKIMTKSITHGLEVEGSLPGSDSEAKKASLYLSRSLQNRDFIQQVSKTMAYALAVIEESASGKTVVTAPTAKSSGIIPGVLYSLMEVYQVSEKRVVRGLITAGMIGKLLYKEILNGNTFTDINIAIAMASAAATQIMGGSPKQVIAAAAISLNDLQHEKDRINSHMSYIELNAMGAAKSLDNATWALLSDKNITKEIDFFCQLTMEKEYIEVN